MSRRRTNWQTLSGKLVWGAVAALVLILGTQLLVRRYLELPQLERLAHRADAKDAERANRGIEHVADGLLGTVYDHGRWDDTYAFIDDLNPRYIAANIVPGTFEALDVDGLLFFDAAGRMRYAASMAADRSIGDVQPFGAMQLRAGILVDPHHVDPDGGIANARAGFVSSSIGPLAFASHPILPSDAEGPSRGTLVIWRVVRPRIVRALGEELGLELSLAWLQDPALPAVERARAEAASHRASLRDRDGNVYWLVDGLDGKPMFLAALHLSEQYFDRGLIAPSVLVGAAVGLLLLSALMWFLAHFLLRPLGELRRQTARITGESGFSERIELDATLEFRLLAERFNRLLDRVEAQDAELKSRNRDLRALSVQDSLTGITNRRGMDEYLDKCWHDAMAHGRKLFLALVDVDHFKRYNDHYGHLEGDRVLRHVAQALGQGLRGAHDLAARYGGEEFCIVALDVDADEAQRMAQALLARIEALQVPHELSPHGFVSISIGAVIGRVVPTRELKHFFREADEALYRAKATGRNRVEMTQLDSVPAQGIDSAL